MKRLIIILVFFVSLIANAQTSSELISFEKLINLKGTPYLLGFVVSTNSLGDINTMSLMSINSHTGITETVDLPTGTMLIDFQQIKMDSIGVNCVAILARIFDADKNDRINTRDPVSLFIVSPDGKQKADLTPSNYYVRLWEVNEASGNLVVTGFYDTNKNGRYDPTEKNEIQIFDMKTLKLIHKF